MREKVYFLIFWMCVVAAICGNDTVCFHAVTPEPIALKICTHIVRRPDVIIGYFLTEFQKGGVQDANSKRNDCWMTLKGQELFRVMNKIDMEYSKVIKHAQEYTDKVNFNKRMLAAALSEATVSYQILSIEEPLTAKLKAGMHLGGHCLLRLPETVLFFHHLKLERDTYFTVKVVHNDLENMMLRAHLSRSDMHLSGGYDHALTNKPVRSTLYSIPAVGDLKVHLEGIQYTMQGRYKFIKERLLIELVLSKLKIKSMKLKYQNLNETEELLELDEWNRADLMAGIKRDLDKWAQDYFNSYLIVTEISDVPDLWKIREYEKYKSAKLATFTDTALVKINKRINDIGGKNIRLPKFRLVPSYGLTIDLYEGNLRGLDTMYRKSSATTIMRRDNLRFVDTIVGFSDLTVSYKYEINFPPGPNSPPSLNGALIMSTKDLTAHLSLGLLAEPEVVDIDINFLNIPGPEDITIEGAANVLKSNFEHILKHQISTIMSNSLTNAVSLLRILPSCVPKMEGIGQQHPKPSSLKEAFHATLSKMPGDDKSVDLETLNKLEATVNPTSYVTK